MFCSGCSVDMRANDIGFKQLANAFLKCAAPDRLQELATRSTKQPILLAGPKVACAFLR
jgi:hypothetical protein